MDKGMTMNHPKKLKIDYKLDITIMEPFKQILWCFVVYVTIYYPYIRNTSQKRLERER
jgi:flagellar biosynthesis/type III secretory pathway M-ring protein FliF/YscJ